MSEITENQEFDEMLRSINFDDLDISYSPMNEESPKDRELTEEFLGVVPAPTVDAPSTSGLAPRDRVCGQTHSGLDPCQGSSPSPPPFSNQLATPLKKKMFWMWSFAQTNPEFVFTVDLVLRWTKDTKFWMKLSSGSLKHLMRQRISCSSSQYIRGQSYSDNSLVL